MIGRRIAHVAWSAVLLLTLAACGQVITRPTATPEPTATPTPTFILVIAARPTPTPEPYTPVPTPTPTWTPTPVIYRIKAGENLWIIAARFGVSHDLLRDVNGITNERALQIGQEIIIPLHGETGPLKPTPTPTPTPLPMTVDHVYFHISPLGELTALGEVYNNSAFDVEQVLVRISLFDAADQQLASGQAYSLLDVIAPGQRAPFVVQFGQAPAHFASYQAEVLSAVPAYLGTLHRDLRPVGVTAEKRPRAPLKLDGRILNFGPEEAVGVEIVVTAYDPLGRVVAARRAVPQHNVVARGGETEFHLEIVPAGPVVTYTIQAQGRRLLPTPTPSE